MKVCTGIKWVVVIMLMVVLCFNVIMTVEGYGIYWEAVDDISLEDKAALIRAKENYTTFDQSPEIYMGAVPSVENHRLYNRPRIDVIVTGRAMLNDVKAGASVEGGSTVAQQLAKNMYSSQEKELVRKVAEILVALDLERNYSRNEILELYANTIYYGNGYCYVRDASNGYFGKRPGDITDCESISLVGIPNTLFHYALTVDQELAARRQQQVLDRLAKCGYFTEERALETMVVGSGR